MFAAVRLTSLSELRDPSSLTSMCEAPMSAAAASSMTAPVSVSMRLILVSSTTMTS